MDADRAPLTTDDLAARAAESREPERDGEQVSRDAESMPGEMRLSDDTPPEPASETAVEATTRPGSDDGSKEQSNEPLIDASRSTGFRSRWESVQAGFVDEPRTAVQDADALVAEVMQELAETFSNERNELEGNWDRGDDVSTEDLRLALRRYRLFFDRLLAT